MYMMDKYKCVQCDFWYLTRLKKNPLTQIAKDHMWFAEHAGFTKVDRNWLPENGH